MAIDPIRQQPAEVNKNTTMGTGTEKIVHDHLKDPNHIITDEHIRNVVVGMSDYVSANSELPVSNEENNTNSEDVDLPSDYDGTNKINNHIPPSSWAIAQ